MATIKKPEYVLVAGDDWQGLYRNGELVIEDHRINIDDAFSQIISGGGVSKFTRVECDYDWLSDRGDLPKSLSEVKLLAE